MRVLLYGGPCRCLLTPLPCISSPACSVASLYTAKQLPQVVHIPPPLCGLPSVAKKLQCMCFACSEGGKAGLGDSLGAFCRWFIVDDVDMLEEDLQLLKSLFDAEGEGLSRQQIEELCAPLGRPPGRHAAGQRDPHGQLQAGACCRCTLHALPEQEESQQGPLCCHAASQRLLVLRPQV